MSKGIALALSGGGYRAALFHAGSLLRLAELGILEKVAHVSAVSGGAIVAGVWADDLRLQPGGTAMDRAKRIKDRVRVFCRHSVDTGTIIGGVLNPFKSVNETLISAYKKHLFPDNPDLSQMPSSPHFTFCASNLTTGRQVYLEKTGISDYRIGFNPHTVSLCEAVAASSAFPPFLSPMDIEINPVQWQLSDYAKSVQRTPPKKLRLTDGGAYDNMGLEPIWDDDYDHVLVSDAGAPYTEPDHVKTDWLSLLNSAFEIATDQSRGLRKRWLIERFKRRPGEEGCLRGTYWGIAGDVADYELPQAMAVNASKTMKMRHIATRLAPFEKGVDAQLINWGYAITDTALRKWCGNLIAVNTAPSWPNPDQSLA